ncbi:Glutamate-1-semialdehyde 2%2C1-aminomutase [[Ruminococcus] torques]|nr:Glutamate-1-semialdehyde 2%2C1-aminomutase [[Ruminococcus] torques]
MAAGLTQLKYLYDHQEIYTELEKKGELLYGGMGKIVKEKGLNYQMNYVGSLGSLFFTGQPVVDYVSAKSSDTVAFAEYFKKMLNMGIHMAPSQFEAMFLSAAHTDEIIMETLDAVKLVL